VSKKINLISPPDTLHNNNFSFNLINTTPEEQEKVSMFLAKEPTNEELNIFVYNNESNPSWLLNTVNGKNNSYINLDNTSDISVQYISYLLSLSGTYYTTNDKNSKEIFSLVNNNFVKNINEFLDKIYEQR
jgi:hypothetical protein